MVKRGLSALACGLDQRAPWQAWSMAADPTGEFEAQRGRLFGLAYRLLGSAADAEDVVQDAFLRWNNADHSAIAAPGAWLAKVVTNLCLNLMSSARAQREAYVGPWLPEPVLTADGTLGPLERVQQRESVTLGLLVLLERLTPAERAVFVLREAFDYSHREIADILELSEANSRQVHRRARQRLSDARPRFHPEPGQWRDLVERFLAATRYGDVPALERVLAAEVTAWADGGGEVAAARRPVSGRLRVARYVTGAFSRFAAGLRLSLAEVNGEPAVLGWSGETLLGMTVLEISGGQITALRTIANPDKLHFAARQAAQLSHSGA
jgi:RNA polymerase sigma-70 factor (ECF subfamily)